LPRTCSYDYAAAAQGLAPGWLLSRFVLNFTVAFVYYAFFYVALYVFKRANRKSVSFRFLGCESSPAQPVQPNQSSPTSPAQPLSG
jgi:hypothetical protein